MSNLEIIKKILNEKYDKLTIKNNDIYYFALEYICEETGIIKSIIRVAIDMWIDDLI